MSRSILLFTLQDYAALASLVGALIVVSVVFFLVFTSSTEEEKHAAKEKVYKARGRYFFGLVAVVVVVLFMSLRLLPYPSFQAEADEVVTVVGMQWAWKMATGVTDKTPAEFAGSNEITLPVNKSIRFMVTSADVNHNFAIYNSSGVLVTQTQAMPQYYNELRYDFTEKGDYEILCLEYCGMAHPYMVGKIHVE
ncbi:MAG: hypothetical protein JSS93_11045 [Bacteroidetes bacterium]|nr:hypothetical protein [Bacteroidota bacterium]